MEVRLLQRPKVKGLIRTRADSARHGTRKPYLLRICLFSDVRPSLFSHLDVEIGGRDFHRRLELAGGALAEYQCNAYGDQHDPSMCARVARELATEVLASA